MRTYVTSLHANAVYTHIGNLDWIACGAVLRSETLVTPEVPEGMALCPSCAAEYEPRPAPLYSLVQSEVLARLAQGMQDAEVAAALGIGLRTVVRAVSDAQRRRGARTRFQFGYLLGQDDAAPA